MRTEALSRREILLLWGRRNAQPLAGVFVLWLLAFVVGKPPSGPTLSRERLHLAYFPNITHAPALVGVADGMFQQALGSTVSLDPRVFNAGPEAMEALNAGEVDVAFVGPGPAINTYLKSKGRALKVLAGVCSGGAALVARKNTPIRSVHDLDGKRVAVPQLGGTQDISLRHFLSQAGLSPKEKGGTVDILPAKNPDILTLIKRGDLDAAWVPEPWVTRLVHEAGARLVVDERTLWPNGKFLTTVVVVRQAYLKQHPQQVLAIMNAHLRSLTWLRQHPQDSQKVVNAELKRLVGKGLPVSVLQESWDRCAFDADLDQDDLRHMIDASVDAGYLPAHAVDVASLLDLNPLQRARAAGPGHWAYRD